MQTEAHDLILGSKLKLLSLSTIPEEKVASVGL